MSDMTVPNEIVRQIKVLDPRALFAWGVKQLVGGDNSLQFKTTGLVKNKGIVKIELNSMDLYNITFGKIRKCDYKELARQDNVYAEDMIGVIDGMVG